MKYKFIILGLVILHVNCIFGQKIYQASLLLDAKAGVGETAIWHPLEKKLYWIDVDKKTLNTFDPVSKTENYYALQKMVGTVVPIDTGGVLVALKDGIYAFNMNTNDFRLLVAPEQNLPDNWLNDGKCDPAGRFWVGSMGPKYKASLYRISNVGKCGKMLDSITISNGIVWTFDKSKMYYIDSPTLQVRQFDYDNETGNISNSKVVITFSDGVGSPDGMAIDTEGKLWIAHWGGSCVSCWNPNTGKMIAKVEVPALNVTSCAFGGEKLDILYITTTSLFMDEASQKKFPASGGVFSVKTGAKGIPANYFKTN